MERGRWAGRLHGVAGAMGLAVIMVAVLSGGPGAAQRLESPVLVKLPYELIGWQAGLPVIQERDIVDLPEGISGTTLHKVDGSTLVLIDARVAHGLCLLRQPSR